MTVVFIIKEVVMEMKLDLHKLKKLRESKAWSQSHLADVSGVSLRTIQRIEKSGIASQESAQSICSAYDILVADIIFDEGSQLETVPTYSSLLKFKVSQISIKATIVSFLIAFIVAYIWAS